MLFHYTTLDDVLEAARGEADQDVIKPAARKALLEAEPRFPTLRRLLTLRTDYPLPDFDQIFEERRTTPLEDTMTDTLDDPAPTQAEIFGPSPKPDPPPDLSPEEQQQPVMPAEAEATTTAAPPTSLVPTPPLQTLIGTEQSGGFIRQLEPRTLNDTRTVAKWLAESRLFSQFGSAQAIFAILLAGRELGLGVMGSLRGFHSVEGRPCMAADLMRALVLASGKAEYFVCTERTTERATWQAQRKGAPQPSTLSYTIEEAQAAGLIKPRSGWEKHPADMLAKTASAKLCRLDYPDVTFGLYTPAELGHDEEL